MVDENDHSDPPESREPTVADLRDLCRQLNDRQARYIVVGGFAIIAAGYNRRTMDIDFLVDASLENEEKVYRVLESLPDQAVKSPGESNLRRCERQEQMSSCAKPSPWSCSQLSRAFHGPPPRKSGDHYERRLL